MCPDRRANHEMNDSGAAQKQGQVQDIGVVGAGIVGLAHAWSAARRGHRVTVFERDHAASGASVRNFGMIWPIGQPAGEAHSLALRSRQAWLELARDAGIWVNPCGSIHLAHQDDEWAVLEEFASTAPGLGYTVELITRADVLKRTGAANPDGLVGGLFSPTELAIDPRTAVRALPGWLARRLGVCFELGATITHIEPGTVRSSSGRTWSFDRTIVCGGADFETLFPEMFRHSGLSRCKLQMLKTVPQPPDWKLGPHLASGLTLRHYANFAVTAALPALKRRIASLTPELDHYGIHVMAAQNDARGSDPRRLTRVRRGHRALRQGGDRQSDSARGQPRDPAAVLGDRRALARRLRQERYATRVRSRASARRPHPHGDRRGGHDDVIRPGRAILGDSFMSRTPPPIRAILFDWAGTTVDHGSRAPVEVFLEVFRREGVEISVSEARGPMGRAKRDHLDALLALPRVAAAWQSKHGRPASAADVDRLYAQFLPLQSAVLTRHGDVIAGVPEVVSACRNRGIKIGATTGYTRALMEVAAPLAKAGGYDPDVIVCADDVPRGRPAPWMIFRAAESLDVYPMSALVVVDDTVTGIEAGLNAGAWTVAVTRTGNSLGLAVEELARLDRPELAARVATAAEAFRQAGAHHVIESVADLLLVLDEIERDRIAREY